jgi:glycosyltransferase involved in cell wall biosynthesis
MRVLVAASSKGSNGALVYAKRVIPMLQEAGHDVWLAAEPGSWIERRKAGQVPIFPTNFRRLPLDEIDRVAAFCRRERIDLVHSHLTRSSNFAAVMRQFHGIRSVAHLHSAQLRLHTGFHDQLIAVSEAVARRQALLPWNWTMPISVLHNCVDGERFRPAPVGSPDRLRAAHRLHLQTERSGSRRPRFRGVASRASGRRPRGHRRRRAAGGSAHGRGADAWFP